jgi:hypothetical protein
MISVNGNFRDIPFPRNTVRCAPTEACSLAGSRPDTDVANWSVMTPKQDLKAKANREPLCIALSATADSRQDSFEVFNVRL